MPKIIPVRHHYIPQFILRPFTDEKGKLKYYDCKSKKLFSKTPEEIFVVPNLYKDVINNPDNPAKVEIDFARFENEAAKIIRKFLDDGETVLTLEEDEKLKLFLATMGLRAKRVKEIFGKKATDENKSFYGLYQKDGNLTDFWTRNLGEIIKCRSLREVLKSNKIDDPMKTFMIRDAFGYEGMYFMLLERRGKEEFVIGDCYPAVMEGESDSGLKLQMYLIYPISPRKLILSVYDGAECVRPSVSGFDRKFFQKPKLSRDRNSIIIPERKIYDNEVKMFNQIVMDWSDTGIVVQNKETLIGYGKEILN